MGNPTWDLLPAVERWLQEERLVRAAVLFGSRARDGTDLQGSDGWSDIDLHVTTTAAATLEQIDWKARLPEHQFCFRAVRPATGGVRKVTAVFTTGQVDLVLVPLRQLQIARFALSSGLYRRSRILRSALHEIGTCLRSGYRFLKGEKEWGTFYAQVAKETPCVRLFDQEVQAKADISLCDLLWILQKLERGELVAAQHVLHRSLAETNLMLMRELLLRRGNSVPSFGLGRRAEELLPKRERGWISVNAALEPRQIRRAAWKAFIGLETMMGELVAGWQVPMEMRRLLETYRIDEPPDQPSAD